MPGGKLRSSSRAKFPVPPPSIVEIRQSFPLKFEDKPAAITFAESIEEPPPNAIIESTFLFDCFLTYLFHLSKNQ